MGSLRDELRDKGLSNEKRERRVRQEKQRHQKEVGAEGLAAEQQRRDAELREAAERKKQQDREREAERRARSESAREEGRVAATIREHRVDGASTAGNRKFFFETREKTVSFLEFSPVAIKNIVDGRHAIVDASDVTGQDFELVAAAAARELQDLEPGRIRFWNADGPPQRRR